MITFHSPKTTGEPSVRNMKEEDAVLLFSGGLDSTTALAWSKGKFRRVSALLFDYGQRHRIELQSAKRTLEKESIEFREWNLNLEGFVESALLGQTEVIPDTLEATRSESLVPATYVPFRNGIFLALAAAFAESIGIRHLVTGFNCIDTPDYPDTTPLFTRSMTRAVNNGTSALKTGRFFKIHTPLIRLNKAEIIAMGIKMGVDYSYSISCYRGEEIPCLHCPSCEIRSRAFSELAMEDPLIARLKQEGKI